MPEPYEPHPHRPLAPSARRALAGTMIYTALGEREMLLAHVLADVLDATAWGILGGAGLAPAEARVVLAALWDAR